MHKEERKERLKLCGILLVLLMTPLLGLVVGALLDHIIAGLLGGIAVGFGATLYLARGLPKDGRQTILWTATGGLIAYTCATQVAGGKAELPIIFMGAMMGAGASLLLPTLRALDEKRKQER